MIRAMRVKVFGFVQGIGYRSWTKKRAEELGLNGWVRNLSDGSVEAYFEGKSNSLSRMIELMKKGPRFARVEKIEIKEESQIKGLDNFQVVYQDY
ncbi:MAG: acylphosphatase [Minisyncoccales bacterium]